jgi:ribosomal protein S18 acetylase RimI-like enzyme
MTRLEPITPATAETFKTVRLCALLDSPSAFGSTYAKEAGLSLEDWQKRAVQWNGERSVGYIAINDTEACGIAAGFLDKDDPTRAYLVSMWVAPTHRGHGSGRQLVDGIKAWAQAQSVQRLYLMVTSNNSGARQFYERLGFRETGRTEPYPNDPALVEHEMVCSISPSLFTPPPTLVNLAFPPSPSEREGGVLGDNARVASHGSEADFSGSPQSRSDALMPLRGWGLGGHLPRLIALHACALYRTPPSLSEGDGGNARFTSVGVG